MHQQKMKNGVFLREVSAASSKVKKVSVLNPSSSDELDELHTPSRCGSIRLDRFVGDMGMYEAASDGE